MALELETSRDGISAGLFTDSLSWHGEGDVTDLPLISAAA
jgi:hypothetical protein